LLVQPAFVIILVVATVHAIRDAPVDAVITYTVAAMLVAEHAWLRRRLDVRPAAGITLGPRSPVIEIAGVLTMAAAFGWWAGRWQLYDWRLKIAAAIPGVLVALLVFTRRPPDAARPPAAPAPRAWPWAAVGAAICLQELVSFLLQPDLQTGSYEHPTISYLVEPLLLHAPPVRGCVLALWLAAGYYLLRLAGLTGRPR
jgi:hypothetical protein